MTSEYVLRRFAGQLRQIQALCAEIPDEEMAEQPGGLPNHPAWVLAHLCGGCANVLKALDATLPVELPWEDQVGGLGRPSPSSDRSAFPPKQELLDKLAALHDAVERHLPERFSIVCDRESPFPEAFPTLGDYITYLVTTHESVHMGQITAWRRLKGYDPLF